MIVKAISQFVVHVFDLIEAEGSALRTAVRTEARRARDAVTDIATGVVFIIMSVPLALAGFSLMAAGFMWWLEGQVGRPLAAALTGAIALAAAGGCLWCFKWFVERRSA